MRKNSTIILLVTVIITSLVIGGAYYMSAMRPSAIDTTRSEADTPIKCHHPDVGEFWTNASTCEGADLSNRLSYSAPLASTAHQDRYNDRTYKTPEQMAADSRSEKAPNPRLTGEPPPDGVPED